MKVVVLTLASVAIIVSALFLSGYNKQTKITYEQKELNLSSQGILAETTKESSLENKDQDGDNLKDWEEILWKTNPNMPDSDFDGTSDGKEVSLGRNPLKPGPNDKLLTQTSDVNQQITKKEELTETDKFARDFFTQFMTARELGIITDATSAENLATQFLQKQQNYTAVQRYLPNNIKTTIDSKESVKEYANITAQIYTKYRQIYQKEPLVFVETDIDTNLEGSIKKFKKMAEIHNLMIMELLQVQTPSNLSNIHLGLINSFDADVQGYLMISEMDKDPLKALAGLEIVRVGDAGQDKFLKMASDYFRLAEITFRFDEVGYFWENYK